MSRARPDAHAAPNPSPAACGRERRKAPGEGPAFDPGERERGFDAPGFLLHADWSAPANVHAFTTLRAGAGGSQPPFDSFNLGNARAADGDEPEAVARNRAELVERAGLPSSPRWLRQVHGTRVLRFGTGAGAETRPHPGPPGPQAQPSGVRSSADHWSASARPHPLDGEGAKAEAEAEPEADAAVTATPGVVLAILTADCLPVVFAARDGSEVGAAHAGWRGLAAGVLEETVAKMSAKPADLIAWLGPAAGPEAYEIGEEVFDAFVSRDPRARAAFAATRPGHWRIDLYALARQRLADAGVAAVHGGGLCTISDPRHFFSHRRDGRSGRLATLAWIA